MHNFKISNVAEFSFKTMSYFGVWRPTFLTSLWAIRLYTLYSISIFLNKIFFVISLLIYLYQNKHKPAILAENLYLFTTLFLLTFKLAYFNVHRQDVYNLLNLFLQKHCLPCDSEEIRIYKKFQYKERLITRIFVGSTFFAVTMYLFWPLTNGKDVSLPFKRWLPYSINSKKIFWMSFAIDSLSCYINLFTYSSMESITAIFMQQICTQIDLFIKRLSQITNIRNNISENKNIYQQECKLLRECVDHHVCIFSMEKKLNEIFGVLIFSQFFVSILNLCTSCFYLTKLQPSEREFLLSLTMLCFYIFQIFIYCLFGEEMTRKSLSITNEIYQMDWNSLSVQTKQKLIIIMMRASRPIQLNGVVVVVLSIETFCKIIKASYSTLNLLRSSN
ncbi:odorant receptor 94a-like [Leptopilina boulardi]|uniref:odorant receptor 94a-like n=1 Tax=Leptopilina boulardi TaxID=63433 RepID=UPI0021F619E0|nr:odorant receptor 94a-like [Leptopilina boulardi]